MGIEHNRRPMLSTMGPSDLEPTALGFYRDLLGFEHVGDMPMPGLSGTMHRLLCGTTTVKLVKLDENPVVDATTGGIGGATGYRYLTMRVRRRRLLSIAAVPSTTCPNRR